MPKYPEKNYVVDILVEVARRAGTEVNADHPEDIAIAMMNAIEHAGVTIDIIHKRTEFVTHAEI